MTDKPHPVVILVVDDDQENLHQLKELLPGEIGGHHVYWDYLDDFDTALECLRARRYDLLVSDIYRDRDSPHKTIAEGDARARDLIADIRNQRFCPVVVFTDGQVPLNLVAHPFVTYADKGAPNFVDQLSARIQELLDTGIPTIARRLHDEIDLFGGSYLWSFVAEKWGTIDALVRSNAEVLERLIRRRAAIQLARIDLSGDAPVERERADAVDYYIYPPIGAGLRLGEVLRRHENGEFRVVLTPHCFLTVQPNQEVPRADAVLTARTVAAADLIGAKNWPSTKPKIMEALRRRVGLPAVDIGTPDGRYCFLPRFMEIPDLYCDLMGLESLPYKDVLSGYERIAVLDAPFAEALQASLGRLYGTVGLPILDPERLAYLGPGVAV